MHLETEAGRYSLVTPEMQRRGRRIKALAEVGRAVKELLRWEIWAAITDDEDGAAEDLLLCRRELRRSVLALNGAMKR